MNKQHWSHNRAKLIASLPHATSAVLIVGNSLLSRNADTPFPFRQDSNVLYASGITKPGVSLLYTVSSASWYVVVPKLSKVETIFDDHEDWDDVAINAGTKGCIDTTEATLLLAKAIGNGDIYTNIAPPKKSHGVYANPLRSEWRTRLMQKKLPTKDLQPFLASLRMIKQPYELELMQHAVHETKATLDTIVTSNKAIKGMTERQLANGITSTFYARHLEHAYQPIVASGRNAAVLHHLPDKTVIAKDAVVLFDVGAEYYGYAADISKTIVHGANTKHEQVINDIQTVQTALIDSLCPGYTWKQLHQQAVQLLTDIALRHNLLDGTTIKQLFPHAIGHFLGLDVHDVGDYSIPLQENMVITVEPGLYSKLLGFGVRIEDDVVITKTGAKIL